MKQPQPQMPDMSTFLVGDNALYVAQLYARYVEDPTAVPLEWRHYFATLGDEAKSVFADAWGPSWAPRPAPAPQKEEPTKAPAIEGDAQQAALDSIRALMLIRAYRAIGHMKADLDPLELTPAKAHPDLDPATYGFKSEDWDRPIYIHDVLGLQTPTLRQIIEKLESVYCHYVGAEFIHIQDPERKQWIQRRLEGEGIKPSFVRENYGVEAQKTILKELTEAESFEQFLHIKFPAAKRFGLDGSEALVPGMLAALKVSAHLGVKETVLGMAHRGRLNVLVNIMGKPARALFSEFQGASANPDDVQGSGDVKYHLGTSSDRDFSGHMMHLSLTANPSHLEAVNPVVVGKVRAKQNQRNDRDHKTVMGILLHGDAAFAGQGIVGETLSLSELHGYRTGGTIHIVINNQVGFTTSPVNARSSAYCTDIAMMIQAPIFHVNGDQPETVARVMELAAEYRHQFGSDVVVDMICYRRFGHNEADEPAFTQPLMYRAISAQTTTRNLYAQDLVAKARVTDQEVIDIKAKIDQHLASEFEASTQYKPTKADWLEGRWEGFTAQADPETQADTGLTPEKLLAIGKALTTVPEGFNLNPKLKRFLNQRWESIETGQNIDWSTGEALAFAGLLLEGNPVRLSGQDVGRGTFTQRHAILRDQTTEEKYLPLNHLSESQAHFEAIDSLLSENAVLGFELGYSLAEPNALVMWEAQFGDFANGAQVIVDQFISSGETKWLRMSGLVMLLPHGYEGQGPEHSSARLERYLQLCAEDNMQVANCTTPANYFHILRRQLHRPFRKPLIMMTPKSLLRHKDAVSTLAEFKTGTSFMPVIPEVKKLASPDTIKRVVICAGKVYYDLFARREEAKLQNVAIVRLEQFYPFPAKLLEAELRKYPNAEVIWCQEEPQNMGAWHFLDRRIESVMEKSHTKNTRPIYVGRKEAASTATGLLSRHKVEQDHLVDTALGLNP